MYGFLPSASTVRVGDALVFTVSGGRTRVDVVAVDLSGLGVVRLQVRDADGALMWLTLDASCPVELLPPF